MVENSVETLEKLRAIMASRSQANKTPLGVSPELAMRISDNEQSEMSSFFKTRNGFEIIEKSQSNKTELVRFRGKSITPNVEPNADLNYTN